MTEGSGMVAYGFSNNPTAAAVRISAKKKSKDKHKVELRSESKIKTAGKGEKNRQNKVKAGKVTKRETQIIAKKTKKT